MKIHHSYIALFILINSFCMRGAENGVFNLTLQQPSIGEIIKCYNKTQKIYEQYSIDYKEFGTVWRKSNECTSQTIEKRYQLIQLLQQYHKQTLINHELLEEAVKRYTYFTLDAKIANKLENDKWVEGASERFNPENSDHYLVEGIKVRPGTTIVPIGDLFGDCNYLSRVLLLLQSKQILDKDFKIIKGNKVIFTGNCAVRGYDCIKTFYLLLCFALQNPEDCHWLRGAYDYIDKSPYYEFLREYAAIYSDLSTTQWERAKSKFVDEKVIIDLFPNN